MQDVTMYNDIPLDIVHKYKYLWVIFSDGTNHFQDQITYTVTVTNRWFLSVQGYLYSLNQTLPPVTIKLFDTLVRPIIEYSSEIWSTCTSYDILETLYLRFLKCCTICTCTSMLILLVIHIVCSTSYKLPGYIMLLLTVHINKDTK